MEPMVEKLIDDAKRERSQTLADLYRATAERALCTCKGHHNPSNPDCTQVAWRSAAAMAERMGGDHGHTKP